MNSDEVYEIKKTWEIPMQNPTDSGSAILVTFFTRYPSNLKFFSAFNDTPVEELNSNPRFRAHANRIIRIFDESINVLGHDYCNDKLVEIWEKIATSHFQRQIEKQSFNELREVILEVLSAACNLNEKQTAAWVKLTDAVYDIIFKALDKLQEGSAQ